MIQAHGLQIFMHSYPKDDRFTKPYTEKIQNIRHANMQNYLTYSTNIFTVSDGGTKLIDQVNKHVVSYRHLQQNLTLLRIAY